MTYAHINGMAMRYRLAGRAGQPRLMFLNSLGSDLRIWDEVVDRLAPHFEILLFDMRGHGLTEATPAPYSLQTLVDDASGLLDFLGWRSTAVVGLSVGGLVAQALTIKRSALVEALVLMDTAARIGDHALWTERISVVSSGGVAAIEDRVARGWVSAKFPDESPAAFKGWRTMLGQTSPEGYVGTCAALRDADLTNLVGHIRVPTLLLAGDADKATTPELVRQTAERIPGSSFSVIDGAGHLPCLERPARVAELIAGHIERARSVRSAEILTRFETGMATRRSVLGDAHVDRAIAKTMEFDAPFQTFITEGAWGTVWAGSHFTRRERSIVTIALLAGLGHHDEVAMHVRATRNTGASPADVGEAFMHVAVYAGVPAANHAFKIAKDVYAAMAEESGAQ